MNISVIGAGYVGLTTAACFAQLGHNVFCSESDLGKLNQLQGGISPIFEPHLQKIMQNAVQSQHLRFGSSEDAINHGDAIFICVGTPPLENGEADLSAIEMAAQTIAQRASGYRLVVEKSTVPVQTGTRLRAYLQLHSRNGLKYDVASNPEFLREGTAVEDFLHPDRIVLGVESPRATDLLRRIYEPLIRQTFSCPIHTACRRQTAVPVLVTDTSSSELIKHASNSFLAMKISFINMVADLCEIVGADVSTVSEGIGLDRRIGKEFLKPGLGFGGFCFPKDLQAFIRIAEKSGCDFSLLKEVQRINQSRTERLLDKVRRELWVIRGKKVAVLGLSFKPNTDDVRFAPSIAIIQRLLDEGAIVSAYDPKAAERTKQICPSINFCNTLYDAAEGAHAVILVTEWEEFRRTDWHKLRDKMEHPLIVDGRNMLDPTELAAFGFQYVAMGRRTLVPSQTVRDLECQNIS